ncbi:uncharacterized protein CTHT_0074400 [Thermochaetoides thermophila DSM 1495]|uniref:Uncharacterized protein n=1 Tax=Chaetomium thermophilum (strain DSM 1495 / CBS 144.50 / IMI 039719) TaxID=759272 RepID=G0SI40_CHATD|nr:hypothetical protein CTHT_0074400 [Thermochaetoides thermophila DSM 1495]EGS17110.1 hypothetical protein CTHT_0074400 [Thermochaetoides thermophila DSM 1495]
MAAPGNFPATAMMLGAGAMPAFAIARKPLGCVALPGVGPLKPINEVFTSFYHDLLAIPTADPAVVAVKPVDPVSSKVPSSPVLSTHAVSPAPEPAVDDGLEAAKEANAPQEEALAQQLASDDPVIGQAVVDHVVSTSDAVEQVQSSEDIVVNHAGTKSDDPAVPVANGVSVNEKELVAPLEETTTAESIPVDTIKDDAATAEDQQPVEPVEVELTLVVPAEETVSATETVSDAKDSAELVQVDAQPVVKFKAVEELVPAVEDSSVDVSERAQVDAQTAVETESVLEVTRDVPVENMTFEAAAEESAPAEELQPEVKETVQVNIFPVEQDAVTEVSKGTVEEPVKEATEVKETPAAVASDAPVESFPVVEPEVPAQEAETVTSELEKPVTVEDAAQVKTAKAIPHVEKTSVREVPVDVSTGVPIENAVETPVKVPVEALVQSAVEVHVEAVTEAPVEESPVEQTSIEAPVEESAVAEYPASTVESTPKADVPAADPQPAVVETKNAAVSTETVSTVADAAPESAEDVIAAITEVPNQTVPVREIPTPATQEFIGDATPEAETREAEISAAAKPRVVTEEVVETLSSIVEESVSPIVEVSASQIEPVSKEIPEVAVEPAESTVSEAFEAIEASVTVEQDAPVDVSFESEVPIVEVEPGTSETVKVTASAEESVADPQNAPSVETELVAAETEILAETQGNPTARAEAVVEETVQDAAVPKIENLSALDAKYDAEAPSQKIVKVTQFAVEETTVTVEEQETTETGAPTAANEPVQPVIGDRIEGTAQVTSETEQNVAVGASESQTEASTEIESVPITENMETAAENATETVTEVATTFESQKLDVEPTFVVPVLPVILEDDFDAAVSTNFDCEFERFLVDAEAWFVPQLVKNGSNKSERDSSQNVDSALNVQNLRLEKAARSLTLTSPILPASSPSGCSTPVSVSRPTTPGPAAGVRKATMGHSLQSRSASSSSTASRSTASAALSPSSRSTTSPGTPINEVIEPLTAVKKGAVVQQENALESRD